MDVSKEFIEYIDKHLDEISKFMFHSDSSNKPMYKAAFLLGCLKTSVEAALDNWDDEDDT